MHLTPHKEEPPALHRQSHGSLCKWGMLLLHPCSTAWPGQDLEDHCPDPRARRAQVLLRRVAPKACSMEELS